MTDDDVPSAARKLEAKAREAGWTVERVPAPTSVAVRLHRGAERLVALWVDGRFKGAWQGWKPDPGTGGVSPRRLSARDLQAVVVGP